MKFKISILFLLLINIMSQAQETKTTTADTLIENGILVEETKTLEEIKIAEEKVVKAAEKAQNKADKDAKQFAIDQKNHEKEVKEFEKQQKRVTTAEKKRFKKIWKV